MWTEDNFMKYDDKFCTRICIHCGACACDACQVEGKCRFCGRKGTTKHTHTQGQKPEEEEE